MANNVAASMTASIVIDKNDIVVQALKELSKAQKELNDNKLEIFFDVTDEAVKKKLKEIQKQLRSEDYVVKIQNQGVEEVCKNLDELIGKVKDIVSGKAFGSGNGEGIGNSIVDEKSLNNIIELFTKMESHLGDMKKVFSDVGDGEEFSPLLKMINNVQSAISELSTNVKGIGLNMNIDVGSDGELDRKLQSKIANALQAYQKLFNNIKMSGAGGSFINQAFFDFNLDDYDTAYQKLQAIVNFIKKQRVEAKKQFNGYDALYEDSDKSLWKSAQSYLAQVTKVETEIKKSNSGESNPLENLFGNIKDLSEVIEQLNKIVEKLNEISSSATEFKNIFKEGFNVTASVEEIDKLTNRVKELEDELSKIKLSPVSVDKSNISSEMKDVFQDGSSSAEKLEQDIKNIESATDRTTESAKEYRKILSQVGEFDIDSKVSAMYKRNDGQLESWTWRAKKDDEGNVLYNQDGQIDYGEPTVTVISKYEQLEKIIVKADNELRNLQRDLAEIKAYDSNASTTNIEAKITDQKEYIRLLEQTVKVISQSDEYLLDEQQIIDARNKAAREYALTMGSKQEKIDAKQSASDEKKRLANIEQVNRALNKQQITIDAIEKTYNKSTNPDLDREVSNQQDLAELAQKKLDIQTKINSLQGQERTSANEQEFLELEKLIAEYKELAKYKLKANNPSKQELGGQNLQTLIQVQISNYDKLITKAEKYGDATTDTVEKLKEQRDILSKIGTNGKYTATADQYYASRDTYKVESAALSAFEAETKAIEQKTQAVKRLNDELEGYNNQIPKKPIDGQRSDYFEGFIQNYKNAINEAREYLGTLGDSPNTKEIEAEWENLINKIKKAKSEMDAVPNAARGSDALSRGKEIDTITKYLSKFTGISKKAKQELKGLLDQLKSDDPSVNVKEIHERFLELTTAEREAGREAKSLFSIFKNKKISSFIGQAASMFSFYDLINFGRKGIDTLKEFDDGLTKISYTMDMTKSKLNDLGDSVLDLSTDMRSSLDDAMSVAQIYANMQTTSEEIQKLSEPTLILTNLSGFDSSTIADDIQAVTQQFDMLAEDSMHIADVYDYISRNIAVDYSKGLNAMAEGLQVAGSTAKQAGLDFEQTASIIAKAVEKTRLEGSQVGNGLKTILTRTSKVGVLSDEVDNETLSQASESLHQIGIEVYNLDGTYREFDVIMTELAGKWDNLTDAEKSNISFALAATRQTNLLSAILSNFSDSMQLAEEATNANGSALENQQKYMDSFAGHLQNLENTGTTAWINLLNSDTLKGGIDILNFLLKVLVNIVDIIGIGTPVVAGFIGYFNKDKSKQRFCPVWG